MILETDRQPAKKAQKTKVDQIIRFRNERGFGEFLRNSAADETQKVCNSYRLPIS